MRCLRNNRNRIIVNKKKDKYKYIRRELSHCILFYMSMRVCFDPVFSLVEVFFSVSVHVNVFAYNF